MCQGKNNKSETIFTKLEKESSKRENNNKKMKETTASHSPTLLAD